MQFTLIGLIVFLSGSFILVARRVEAAFAFTLICTLMGGSAAIIVTALGSASISPAHLALGFLFMRVCLRRHGEPLALHAFKLNLPFLVFTVYSVASAIALPRIFKNKMDVVPMRPSGLRSLYDAFPLVPTSQNVTTAVYIVGTFLLAICTVVAVRQPRGVTMLVKATIAIVALHALTGILSAVAGDTIIGSFLSFFRNGSYAQLEQTAGGYVRIAGIMPEASTYAAYGFGWFCFIAELWLRDIMPRRTGPLAAIMALVLVCSTSSTAYVCLAAYILVLGARMLIFPRTFGLPKILWLFGFTAALIVIACLVMLLQPALAESLLTLFERMTIGKATTTSGLQRAFWAKQGLLAFQTSMGLGIGVGSFRSSSFVTAVIGSVGIIGTAAMLVYFATIFRPLRSSTYGRPVDQIEAVGVAASWAAMMNCLPQAISWPSPDPGLSFAIFAGVALGLRSIVRSAPSPARPWEAPRPPLVAAGSSA